jgi:transposase-like protein
MTETLSAIKQPIRQTARRKRHGTRFQAALEHDIQPVPDCPHCVRAMTVDAVIPGIFLRSVFVRYRCERCNRETEVSLPPVID